jgi:hypothetical protein
MKHDPTMVDEPSREDLRVLDAMGPAGVWQVFGRELRVTNLDKVLFPGRAGESPVTKREFLAYTARIAPILLPYLTGRPLNLHRYPDGAQAGGFWHKELPEHAPDWPPRWDNPQADPGETRTYLVVDEPAALVGAANFGALEWHAWTSRTADPRQPTYALIYLDPGNRTSWHDFLVLARLHHTAFDATMPARAASPVAVGTSHVNGASGRPHCPAETALAPMRERNPAAPAVVQVAVACLTRSAVSAASCDPAPASGTRGTERACVE